MHGAGRVLCMGQGSSMVLAEEAWTLLSSISPKFVLVPDSHQQMAALACWRREMRCSTSLYSGSTRSCRMPWRWPISGKDGLF